jgi:hypothetical protein
MNVVDVCGLLGSAFIVVMFVPEINHVYKSHKLQLPSLELDCECSIPRVLVPLHCHTHDHHKRGSWSFLLPHVLL